MKRTVQMKNAGIPKAGMREGHFKGFKKPMKTGPLIVYRAAWHAKREKAAKAKAQRLEYERRKKGLR